MKDTCSGLPTKTVGDAFSKANLDYDKSLQHSDLLLRKTAKTFSIHK